MYNGRYVQGCQLGSTCKQSSPAAVSVTCFDCGLVCCGSVNMISGLPLYSGVFPVAQMKVGITVPEIDMIAKSSPARLIGLE